MVNDVETITIFNRKYDGDLRRDIFFPTVIQGVTLHAVKGRTGTRNEIMGNVYSEKSTYQVRVPITAKVQDDRAYIDEEEYRRLADTEISGYWTLSATSYFIIGGKMPDSEEPPKWNGFTEDELTTGLDWMLIPITEYADNTRRGTKAVRHWRIGGA